MRPLLEAIGVTLWQRNVAELSQSWRKTQLHRHVQGNESAARKAYHWAFSTSKPVMSSNLNLGASRFALVPVGSEESDED